MPDWLDFAQIAEWVSGAWWSYPVIFAVSAIDAFFPVVPSETTVITAGVFASSGDLNLFLVILFAAAGAIVGDNISYGIGTLVGERTVKKWFSSEKSHRRLEWAERQLLPREVQALSPALPLPSASPDDPAVLWLAATRRIGALPRWYQRR